MNQKATTEFEIEVSGGRITCEKEIADGKYKLVVEMATTTDKVERCAIQKHVYARKPTLKEMLRKVSASQLSLNDDFMKYDPKLERVKEFKNKVIRLISEGGLPDFWSPICDPSFDDNGGICFELGKMPAVGKSYNWWSRMAKIVCPECGSRIGDDLYYIAFKAVLIKDLIASGKSIEFAWHVVCVDSKDAGHYWDSEDAKHRLEPTGSRPICGWYDRGNTTKIVESHQNSDGFYLAGADYNFYGHEVRLADIYYRNDGLDEEQNFGCGWLVFDRCPD